MATPRTRSISSADLEAAARLKAIWLAIPRDRRPTQQHLADVWDGGGEANQSLISQYMTGKIALNYRAVLFFARELGVCPEDIRSDLPEQKLAVQGSFATSGTPSHLGRIDTDILIHADEVVELLEEMQGARYPRITRLHELAVVYNAAAEDGGKVSLRRMTAMTEAAIARRDQSGEKAHGRSTRPGSRRR